MDTLTPINIFLIIQIHNFWGDLSDVSVKTATLLRSFSVDVAETVVEEGDAILADNSLVYPENHSFLNSYLLFIESKYDAIQL